MNFKILLHEELSLRIKFLSIFGEVKEIISLVLLLEGTKSRKATAHFRNIFLSMVLWIFAVLYLVNFVSFVGAALFTMQRLQGQFFKGDLVIPSDSLCAGRYWSFIGIYQSTTYLILVVEFKVFARIVCFVDNFGKSKFLWAIFEEFMIDLE